MESGNALASFSKVAYKDYNHEVVYAAKALVQTLKDYGAMAKAAEILLAMKSALY